MTRRLETMLSAMVAAPWLLVADTADSWVFDSSRRPAETVSQASASLAAPGGILHALGSTVAQATGRADGRFQTRAVSDAGSLSSLPRTPTVIQVR